MKTRGFKRVIAWVTRAILILAAIIVVTPLLLYIPAVQDFAKDIAVKEIKKSTGMDISVGRLRIRFPLKVELYKVSLVEKNAPDTMLVADGASVDVSVLPLLKGNIDASAIEARGVKYTLGTPDSILYLTARVKHARIEGGGIELRNSRIKVERARVEGVDTRLILKPDTAPTPRDTTTSKPWMIEAHDIEIVDVRYRMRMMPTIDSLDVSLDRAQLLDGRVDLGKHLVDARFLGVDSVAALYLLPSPAYLKAHPELTVTAPVDTTTVSEPWTVTADSLRLSGRRATYAIAGAKPQPGLDLNYIQASDIAIAVDNFMNRGTEISVPIRELRATERCGLSVSASGTFAMDSTAMSLKDLKGRVGSSTLDVATATMGLGDTSLYPLSLDAIASIRLADVVTAMPSLRHTLGKGGGSVNAVAKIEGSLADLDVEKLNIDAAGLLKLNAHGRIHHIDTPDKLDGKITLDGSIRDGSTIARLLPAGTLPQGLNIPNLALAGTIDYAPKAISGKIKGTTGNGTVALDGNWTASNEGYRADLDLRDFPVDAFMPSLGIGMVTASLTAAGHGYNPMKASTKMNVDLTTALVEYKGDAIRNVTLTAHASGGETYGHLDSTHPGADLDLNFQGRVTGNDYAWDIDGNIRDLDLRAIKLMTDTCGGSMKLKSTGTYNTSTGDIAGTVTVDDLDWQLPGMRLVTPEVAATASMTKDAIEGTIDNGDLRLKLATREGLDSITRRLALLPAVIDSTIHHHKLDVERLQKALPRADAILSMGPSNLAADILSQRGMGIDNTFLSFSNDSLLKVDAHAYGFTNGKTTIDTLHLEAYQRGNTLVYNAEMGNAPGTMDNFAMVRLNGFLASNRLSAYLHQKNIKGDQGYNIGLLATLNDSVASLRLMPTSPTLAYRKFELNNDNFVKYNLFSHHIDADLSLSDGLTSLRLYTEHEGEEHVGSDPLIADIKNLHLSDYLSLSPFAPPIKGDLSAHVKLQYQNDKLTGNGTMQLADFYYDRKRVGSFDMGLDVFTDPKTGFLRANADLAVDNVKTMTVTGVLNDSTSVNPMSLDFTVIHFPLKVANPFIPANTASLDGTLNGNMSITGTTDRPVFNGSLSFDSGSVLVSMLGTKLTMPGEQIPVKDSKIYFDDFGISAINDNPLYINGNVDINDLSNPSIALNVYGHDVQVVNSDRPRGADVYGKGYISVNADVKGNMRFMMANAKLTLLEGSNVTYVLPADQSARLTEGGKNDMVHFVQFNDTTLVNRADSIVRESMLVLDAGLVIDDGTTINVDLNPEGTNKVSLQSNANLTYTSSPVNSGRLIGRINVNGGYVRYTPPLMSEKLFNFEEGSYVAFNGDILNPTLNVKAYDVVKANVTRSGENSRLVNFDVEVSVNGTLQTMNVAFDMSTRDDITVSNELASMSPDQRANQAMNLLLYGIYQGAGTTGNANIGGNLLYSFVESKLNNWMANNIKGVDISFGIDQYNQTYNGETSTAMNYSYHVSKTLFNDRFKIIVGGTYTTAADNDENVAESLFNDISAEYMLNRAGSMYIKIFRHTGYESILEGEITQTGVGFVYRRRLLSLRDMFRFGSRNKSVTQPFNGKDKQ